MNRWIQSAFIVFRRRCVTGYFICVGRGPRSDTILRPTLTMRKSSNCILNTSIARESECIARRAFASTRSLRFQVRAIGKQELATAGVMSEPPRQFEEVRNAQRVRFSIASVSGSRRIRPATPNSATAQLKLPARSTIGHYNSAGYPPLDLRPRRLSSRMALAPQRDRAAELATGLKRFSPGLNRGIPKRLAVMESFVH